jgi:hypothetical protein
MGIVKTLSVERRMQIKFYKALWGMEAWTMEQNVERIKAAGYDGVEVHVLGTDPKKLRRMAREKGLGLIFQVTGDDAKTLTDMYQTAAEHEPELIVTHAGRDHFTFDEGCAFWEKALAAEEKLGVPVVHETHRSRLLFSPWSTAQYLRQFPALRINADFSHWCCVTETLLDHLDGMVEAAVQRAMHVHARVGHEQGPQVSDPRAPEYANHVKVHMEWWRRIIRAREADGTKVLRIVPEFGPPGYMQTLPFTRQPVADLWEVCLWMRDKLKAEL